jgi:hypothetical protein
MYRFAGSITSGKATASISISSAVGDSFGIGVIFDVTVTAAPFAGFIVGTNPPAAF